MSDRCVIERVGVEPTVNAVEDESGRIVRYEIICPGWEFHHPDGPEFGTIVLGIDEDGNDVTNLITVMPMEDKPPVDTEWIEHGHIKIGGYTLGEMRAIALFHREFEGRA